MPSSDTPSASGIGDSGPGIAPKLRGCHLDESRKKMMVVTVCMIYEMKYDKRDDIPSTGFVMVL